MTLSSPEIVQERLERIDDDLAGLQNEVEEAAWDWFVAKRDREKAKALAFLTAKGTDFARRACAEADTADIGKELEARYEALRSKMRVLETRATIGQSILKAQGRS